MYLYVAEWESGREGIAAFFVGHARDAWALPTSGNEENCTTSAVTV